MLSIVLIYVEIDNNCLTKGDSFLPLVYKCMEHFLMFSLHLTEVLYRKQYMAHSRC